MKSILIRALSLFLIFSISAATAVEIREERAQFKPGETGATIKGRIKGRQIVDYRLSAKAGQSMAVIMETSNRSNYTLSGQVFGFFGKQLKVHGH